MKQRPTAITARFQMINRTGTIADSEIPNPSLTLARPSLSVVARRSGEKLMLSHFRVEKAAHCIELAEVECENSHCLNSMGLGLENCDSGCYWQPEITGLSRQILPQAPAPKPGLTWILSLLQADP